MGHWASIPDTVAVSGSAAVAWKICSKLVGGLEGLFFEVLGISSSQLLTNLFQKRLKPPTSIVFKGFLPY